ncbi:MAG: response regulator, partial [Pseudomonadales bacterium]
KKMPDKIKYKIFIIEDEALVARELKSRLTNMGYEVVGIAYGRGGIDLALETRPDLLLTDIHLKDGEDGIEVAQSIQRDLDVPVVFLTAYSDEDTVARAKAVTPYGYIIKPVENRELQITIEMALYKFNIERELRETQQLLQTALTCIGSALVFVNHNGEITDLNSDAERLFHVQRRSVIGQPWLDIFSLDGDSSVGRKISLALQSHEVTKLAPFIISSNEDLPNLVDGIVGPMESGGVIILRELSRIHDPVEMLARPEELMANLGADRLSPSESTMCQLLIAVDVIDGSPDAVIMASVTSKLNQMLRATDLVSRFGDNQLSVSMPYTATSEGQQIAQSILRALKHLESNDGHLVFSIGLSSTTSGDQQPFELFRRASWALNVARESGGSRVISWSDKSEQPVVTAGQEDRQREYHNLVLLWNVMNVVVKSSDEETLADKLTHHLLHSFDFSKVALLESRADSIASIAGAIDGQEEFYGVGDLSLTQEDFGRIHKLSPGADSFAQYRDRYLFALAGNKVLYIESREQLAATEVEFLQTLVSYFAARFASDNETTSVSPDLPESELVYRSPRMESIMESVNLVGPTDATVLIMGESGTGK